MTRLVGRYLVASLAVQVVLHLAQAARPDATVVRSPRQDLDAEAALVGAALQTLVGLVALLLLAGPALLPRPRRLLAVPLAVVAAAPVLLVLETPVQLAGILAVHLAVSAPPRGA